MGLNRYYDKKYLDMAGVSTPRTIEEFYEFAMYISQVDLDGNGKNDTYAVEYTEHSWLNDLRDIFRAFGCFSYGQSPIAYNPLKGMYENCIFNENFIEAMTFVKLLNDEGVLINITTNLSYGAETMSYETASTIRLNPEYNYSEGMALGNYLLGLNSEKLVENRGNGTCFAVLEGTTGVSEGMNAFLSMLMNSPNGYMDFSYGVEGVHYTEDAEFYNVKTTDEAGNFSLKRLSMYIRLEDMGFSNKRVIYDGADNQSEYADVLSELEIAREEALPISDAVIYTIPLNGFDSQLDVLRSTTYGPTRDLIKSILSVNVPIETAIESYRKRLSGLKVFDKIDEMNMNLN